jgi:hypothetical protein
MFTMVDFKVVFTMVDFITVLIMVNSQWCSQW